MGNHSRAPFVLFATALAVSAASPPETFLPPTPFWKAPNVLDFLRYATTIPVPRTDTAKLHEPISQAVPSSRTQPHTASIPLSLTRALGLKINRIVIDAGHGGADFGAVGRAGLREKDIVLDIALRVAQMARESMGIDVVLTRSTDIFVPLRRRTAIANEAESDLFLSIHANSSPSQTASGAEVFVLSLTGTGESLEFARRENAGTTHTAGQLPDLVRSIAMNDKLQESSTLAEMLQTPLFIEAAKSDPATRNRGIRHAPFLVLMGASMPSVLAEIGFLSNRAEETRLRDPAWRQQIAIAIYAGLAQYSDSLNASCVPSCL